MQDVGNEIEKKAKPTEMHYRVGQSSGQPVLYSVGTSDAPHEKCLRTDYVRDKSRKSFSIDSTLPFIKGSFVPLILFKYYM